MIDRQEQAERLFEELSYCDFRNQVGIDKAIKIIRMALLSFERQLNKDSQTTPREKIEMLRDYFQERADNAIKSNEHTLLESYSAKVAVLNTLLEE
jgi:hypothetical protein